MLNLSASGGTEKTKYYMSVRVETSGILIKISLASLIAC